MQVESGGGGLVRGALVASEDGEVEGEEGQPHITTIRDQRLSSRQYEHTRIGADAAN